jgi:hypothetical protein
MVCPLNGFLGLLLEKSYLHQKSAYFARKNSIKTGSKFKVQGSRFKVRGSGLDGRAQRMRNWMFGS